MAESMDVYFICGNLYNGNRKLYDKSMIKIIPDALKENMDEVKDTLINLIFL